MKEENQEQALDLVVSELLRVLLEAERVEAEVAGAVNGAVTELEEEGDFEEADEPENLQDKSMSAPVDIEQRHRPAENAKTRAH